MTRAEKQTRLAEVKEDIALAPYSLRLQLLEADRISTPSNCIGDGILNAAAQIKSESLIAEL